MTDLEIWCALGWGRITSLAKKAGCSRQNMEKRVKSKCSDDSELWDLVESIEASEAADPEKCKYNLIKAAQFTASTDERLASQAQHSLNRWAYQYSNFFGANT